jgi:choline dehydrogenase-like flavoprotein
MDTQLSLENQALTALSVAGASTYDALFEQLFPADGSGPGASGIRVIQYLDRALSAPDAHRLETYRLGVYVLDAKAEEILGEMGATKTWRGDRLTGVGSSRDFGGARMADERQNVVVNSELRVHDTPGLHVYSGAAFRTRPGINPTLSLLALVYRAAERLVQRIANGEEQ